MRRSAGEHLERTTIRRREVDAGNGKRSRVGADRSSGRPPTESERIGDRGDKLITRIPSSVQIRKKTNRVLLSFPQRSDSRTNQSRPAFTPLSLPDSRTNQSRPAFTPNQSRPAFTSRFHSPKPIASRFHSPRQLLETPPRRAKKTKSLSMIMVANRRSGPLRVSQ
jgi:hypothetical protein